MLNQLLEEVTWLDKMWHGLGNGYLGEKEKELAGERVPIAQQAGPRFRICFADVSLALAEYCRQTPSVMERPSW